MRTVPDLVPIRQARQALDDLPLLARIAQLRAAFDGLLRNDEVDARLRRLRHRDLNEYGYDPFGYNPAVVRKIAPLVDVLHRYYFRTEVFGVENIPPTGRVLLVANHSGQLPIDGAVVGASVLFDAPEPRVVRAMVERFVPKLPWVSVFFQRCGQMLGAPENCVRLLEADEAVLVFPEGAEGISKAPSKAYQLTRFGYGFMRLAIRTGTPIIPIAVIGGEEQYVRVANIKPLAKALKIPAVPLFLFGALPIPGGLLPLPVRYRLHFGAPMIFDGDPDDDDAVIGQKVKQVKGTIQRMIHTGLSMRRSVFW